ncbi:D-sedoheptulose-7-phosphate isomerase [Sphingomonas sp. Tas61C01]|uniref:D-sedoheptulose-7-phosphate isomerase n=1 Tax=Sphingomonas sp. Tas61C01 TaxID=3458297 RepID=UPI00403E8951
MSVFAQNLAEHRTLFATLDGLEAEVIRAGDAIAAALQAGGKVMFCGNGGSAADSQHLAAEFTGRFIADRRPLAGLALSTDSSALTCIGNDYGFDHVFARQLEALGRAGDCLVGISTSGNSPNVIHAFRHARATGIVTIGLLGRDGGELAQLSDIAIVVPSPTTARIQEAHIMIGHTLCGMAERALGLA